jgi:transposase
VIFPDQASRIVIATKPVDFRKGHDGLAAMAHAELGFAPKAGVMVVFRSKRGDRIKVLFWDGSGIVMIYKRLEQGGFAWPKVGDGVMRLSRVQFEALTAITAAVRTVYACLTYEPGSPFFVPLPGSALGSVMNSVYLVWPMRVSDTVAR